jgi:hypothetical protein
MAKEKFEPPTAKEFEAITSLAGKLAAAKVKEAAATQNRVAIEVKLACLIPCSDEGQRTISLADKRKVTVERGFNYAVDYAELSKLAAFTEELPPPIAVKSTRSLSLKGYRWYRENHPKIFSVMAKHVSAKPKKVAVSIKLPK